jgi:hypothetical protein
VRYFSLRLLGGHVGAAPPLWKRRWLNLACAGLLALLYLPVLPGRLVVTLQGAGSASLTTQDLAGIAYLAVGLAAAALGLYALAFAASWLAWQIKRLAWPARCGHCRQTVPAGGPAGQVCPACGQDLAPWLFYASSAVSEGGGGVLPHP